MGLSVEVVLPDGRRFENARRGLEAFARNLEVAFPASEFSAVAQRELKNYLDTVAKAMRDRHSGQWAPFRKNPAGERTGRLNSRTGKLVRAIEQSVDVNTDGQVVVGRIGGDELPPYAVVHEEGATIRAKNARFLTIPLPAALDSRGVPLKRKARDWPNTFVQMSKKGNLIIFQRRGANIVPLYVLKKSVKIPPRLGLGKTIELTQGAFVDKLFDSLVREINERVG